MAKQEMVAMLLAGGQGSRLGALTEYVAKPAVPFGSRYRIIDFPLSNCTNSGIETVGVLTQYQPLELNRYMGNGHSWDLDRNSGGLSILPPFQRSSHSEWYKGTANAIYQNLYYLDSCDPAYVLVLSGDHIYKMDYDRMLKRHVASGADATIAVIEVPWSEASRFGIMACDEEGRIVEFAEKPAEPRSNLASMGVYIFSWPLLRAQLKADEADPNSQNDFGRDIIPKLLRQNKKLMSYEFKGYWKDVGTICSLWEANMDLLDHPEELALNDSAWRIYSRNPVRPPHFIAEKARVEASMLTDGDVIAGEVRHSVLSSDVVIEPGATVIDSVLMPGVRIGAGAYVEKCIIGMNARIGANSRLGPQIEGSSRYLNPLCTDGITVVANKLSLREELNLPGGSMISYTAKREHDPSVVEVLKSCQV